MTSSTGGSGWSEGKARLGRAAGLESGVGEAEGMAAAVGMWGVGVVK